MRGTCGGPSASCYQMSVIGRAGRSELPKTPPNVEESQEAQIYIAKRASVCSYGISVKRSYQISNRVRVERLDALHQSPNKTIATKREAY